MSNTFPGLNFDELIKLAQLENINLEKKRLELELQKLQNSCNSASEIDKSIKSVQLENLNLEKKSLELKQQLLEQGLQEKNNQDSILDKSIKSVQLENLNLEKTRLELEQQKLNEDIRTKKKGIITRIIIVVTQVLLGLGFWTFYYTYVFTPISQLELTKNRLELAKKEESLYLQEFELSQNREEINRTNSKLDSVIIEKNIISDSLITLNNTRDQLIVKERRKFEDKILSLNQRLREYSDTITLSSVNVSSLEDSIKIFDDIITYQNELLNKILGRERQITEDFNSKNNIGAFSYSFQITDSVDTPLANADVYLKGEVVGRTDIFGFVSVPWGVDFGESFNADELSVFINGNEFNRIGNVITDYNSPEKRITLQLKFIPK